MPDLDTWHTSVTEIAPGSISYRGTPVGDAIDNTELAAALWLVLFGGTPTPGGLDALRRAVIAALDHGVAAPSTLAARATASTRGSVPLAIASGMIAFAGPAHGGAAEQAALMFTPIAAADDVEKAAHDAVAERLARRERIPGYGHPYHPNDPRVPGLLGGIEPNRRYRDIAALVEKAVAAQLGRTLAMNADAAVAALLLDAGLGPGDVTLVTALGRAVGLAAHAREEQTQERPFRAPALRTVRFEQERNA